MNAVDLAVLILYLILVLGIGIYFSGRTKDHADFFLAGRSMGWFPIGLSIMVTVFSAINYLALPNEVFGHGLHVVAALPVFFLAAWPITKIWMPFFHEMRLTSVYEYMERRFDARTRSLASGLFIMWRLFWMATALYASGNIVAALTNVKPTTAILLGGLVATCYTSIGGMRAVLWTDVAQFFVLFGGIALGTAFAVGDDGLASVFEIARAGGRLKPFLPFEPRYFSISPFIRMTFWSGLIGVFVAFLARYGADQVVTQRYFSAKNLSAARRGLWFNAIVSVASLSLLALFGLMVYAHAVKTGSLTGVEWELISPIRRKALAMGQLAAMIRSFPSGVTGLVVAGLFAATMSSVDSGVNACSAAYVTDFHQRFFASGTPKGETGTGLDRLLTLALGVAATGMALALIPLIGRTNSLFMIVNKVVNGLGSPLLALFLLGMFTRCANAPGVFFGGIVGLLTSLVISFAASGLALQYYAVANLLATVAPCLAFSLIATRLGHFRQREGLDWTWWAWRDKRGKLSSLAP